MSFWPGCRIASHVRMTSRSGTAVLSSALFILSLPGCSRSQAQPATPPPPPVPVIEIKPETVPIATEWVATLDGFVNAQVRPQVPGYLIRTTYREGAFV